MANFIRKKLGTNRKSLPNTGEDSPFNESVIHPVLGLNSVKAETFLKIIVLTCIILYFGKSLFIPIGFAIFISFILFPICRWLENRGIPRAISIAIILGSITTMIGSLSFLVLSELFAFSSEWIHFNDKIMSSLEEISKRISEQLGLSSEKQAEILQNTLKDSINITVDLIGSITASVTDGLYTGTLVLIFSALILYYRSKILILFHKLFPENNISDLRAFMGQIGHTYYSFIKGMSIVYVVVGVLNSIGLAIIGIPYAILFGCLASVLTFIPYIGIMVASILPISIAWVTYGSIWYPIAVISVFATVQILEAYVIFPLAVGQNLKINTLVVFLAIAVGGLLWGASGMILFIPMVSIIKMISERIPSLKYLSEFME